MRKAIETKNARITELEERLSKYEKQDRDSNNSSTSRSQENIKSKVVRRTKSLHKKYDKLVGGQPGHEGSTLKESDFPDEIANHQFSFCEHCDADLSDIAPVLDYTNQ